MDPKAFLLPFLGNEIEKARRTRFGTREWSLMRKRTTLMHAKPFSDLDSPSELSQKLNKTRDPHFRMELAALLWRSRKTPPPLNLELLGAILRCNCL